MTQNQSTFFLVQRSYFVGILSPAVHHIWPMKVWTEALWIAGWADLPQEYVCVILCSIWKPVIPNKFICFWNKMIYDDLVQYLFQTQSNQIYYRTHFLQARCNDSMSFRQSHGTACACGWFSLFQCQETGATQYDKPGGLRCKLPGKDGWMNIGWISWEFLTWRTLLDPQPCPSMDHCLRPVSHCKLHSKESCDDLSKLQNVLHVFTRMA